MSGTGCYKACCPLGAATGVSCPPDSCDLEEGGRDVERVLMDAGETRRALAAAKTERDAAGALSTRYATAILFAASTNSVAFDPMNPEGWMHAQVKYMLDLIADRDRLATELEDSRRVAEWLHEDDDNRTLQASHAEVGQLALYDASDDECDPFVVSGEDLPALGRAIAATEARG